MSTRPPVTVACLDLQALSGFFRSVALCIEIQANTRLEWKEYKDSTVLNIAYALMPWKGKPGTAEVSQNWTRIRQNTDGRSRDMLLTFLDKLSDGGPAAAAAYAEQMQGLRQYTQKAVQELFADANQINAMVAGTAGQAARNLAIIQFGCTVLLAATGCWVALGGAVPAVLTGGMTATQVAGGVGAVNLGYNVVGAFVKDAFSWKTAQTVAIEVGKDKGGGAAMPWLANQATNAARDMADQGRTLQEAEAKIAKMNQKMAGKLGDARRARYARGVARETQVAAQAQGRIAQAGTMRTVATVGAKAIPIVFLAHDIYNAVGDLTSVLDATR
jgi:hypothetical protein